MKNEPEAQKQTKEPKSQVPGVKEQGAAVGSSHANQGNWETKEGKALAPPKAGHVEKTTAATETTESKKDETEKTGNGAEIAGGP